MTAAITFWVLIVVSASNDHSMVAQQFVSERACNEAKTFIEDKRGTYVFAKCILDTAQPAGARASQPGREVRP